MSHEACTNVCIVIPVFNEQESIYTNLKEISSYVKELSIPTKLLVIDDGSDHNTKLNINKAINNINEINIDLITHNKNCGYGRAIKTGLNYAKNNSYEYILFMDSDLTNHPKYLADFIEKIKEGYDYIKASRYIKGGKALGVPKYRKLISFLGNNFAKIMYRLPVNDVTNGFRAGKTNIIYKCQLNEDDFSIIIEELKELSKLPIRFCEIPYLLTTRKTGVSRFPYKISTCIKYISILNK